MVKWLLSVSVIVALAWTIAVSLSSSAISRTRSASGPQTVEPVEPVNVSAPVAPASTDMLAPAQPDSDGAVTVDHAFGRTEIATTPTRVVTWGGGVPTPQSRWEWCR